ncbi:hypothetical protein VKT23_012954 [Stygiomarasmius scandens]|uniref:Uncharacterized protein n=1 Tax=Marasmiellus scandens TaxID=2682957 RepID=A0ABR1J7G4_9AGAR
MSLLSQSHTRRKRPKHPGYPIPCAPPDTTFVFGFPLSDDYVVGVEDRLHPIPSGASEEEMAAAVSISSGLARIHWRELCEKACLGYRAELAIAVVDKQCISFIYLSNTTHVDRMRIPPREVLVSLRKALKEDGWEGKLGWYELYDW